MVKSGSSEETYTLNFIGIKAKYKQEQYKNKVKKYHVLSKVVSDISCTFRKRTNISADPVRHTQVGLHWLSLYR